MKYHTYIFFAPKDSLSVVPEIKLSHYKKEFIEILQKEKKVISFSYATLGLTGNAYIMFWMQSDSLNTLQDVLNTLLHTALGKHLKITGTLFGIVRPSQYSKHLASEQTINTQRTGAEYLVIYPFTKTTQWYQRSFEERHALMKEHIAIGMKYPHIQQLLLYSFGLDDNEFIVSYETDNLEEFQTLVMELRSDPGRKYTKNDTPIFTCAYKPLEKILEYI